MSELTKKQLVDLLDRFPDDAFIGISVWNPISQCYDYTDIANVNWCKTTGFRGYIAIETIDDLKQLAHERSFKPQNKNKD
jgi:hypothetical protein